MTHDPEDLDAMFAQARRETPSASLVARVLQDAEGVQAEITRPEPAAAPTPWWSTAIAALGGWGAVSGITAAGVMGLAVGLYAPDTVNSLTWAGFLGDYGLAPDLDDLWAEDGDV